MLVFTLTGHIFLISDLAYSLSGDTTIRGTNLNKKENILYPVPHRQYVFSLPIILRVYFKHRKLLTKLCHCAYESLLEFLNTTIGLSDGVPGVVMTIHTFGDYMEKFHPPPKTVELVYEPCYDDWPIYEEHYITVN